MKVESEIATSAVIESNGKRIIAGGELGIEVSVISCDGNIKSRIDQSGKSLIVRIGACCIEQRIIYSPVAGSGPVLRLIKINETFFGVNLGLDVYP